MSSLTAIEIVSILKLIIPELDTFLHSTSIADIISELDTSITYQEILSHYITTEVLNTYPQYIKKKVLLNLLIFYLLLHNVQNNIHYLMKKQLHLS